MSLLAQLLSMRLHVDRNLVLKLIHLMDVVLADVRASVLSVLLMAVLPKTKIVE